MKKKQLSTRNKRGALENDMVGVAATVSTLCQVRRGDELRESLKER